MFNELFEYNATCNERLIAAFQANSEQASLDAYRLFSHILNAHHIWNHRIRGISPTLGVWDLHNIARFNEINTANHELTAQILADANDEEIISYKTFAGQEFRNRIRDVLFHIVNHSTYHRAQIATLFRQCGIEPLASDYVHYKRL